MNNFKLQLKTQNNSEPNEPNQLSIHNENDQQNISKPINKDTLNNLLIINEINNILKKFNTSRLGFHIVRKSDNILFLLDLVDNRINELIKKNNEMEKKIKEMEKIRYLDIRWFNFSKLRTMFNNNLIDKETILFSIINKLEIDNLGIKTFSLDSEKLKKYIHNWDMEKDIWELNFFELHYLLKKYKKENQNKPLNILLRNRKVIDFLKKEIFKKKCDNEDNRIEKEIFEKNMINIVMKNF